MGDKLMCDSCGTTGTNEHIFLLCGRYDIGREVLRTALNWLLCRQVFANEDPWTMVVRVDATESKESVIAVPYVVRFLRPFIESLRTFQCTIALSLSLFVPPSHTVQGIKPDASLPPCLSSVSHLAAFTARALHTADKM